MRDQSFEVVAAPHLTEHGLPRRAVRLQLLQELGATHPQPPRLVTGATGRAGGRADPGAAGGGRAEPAALRRGALPEPGPASAIGVDVNAVPYTKYAGWCDGDFNAYA